MNLKPFVNKEVVVQLKPGCGWIACLDSGGGRPVPMETKDQKGDAQIVTMPFVIGKLLERDGAYVLKYAAHKGNMECTLVVEAIFAVTCVSEDKILAP